MIQILFIIFRLYKACSTSINLFANTVIHLYVLPFVTAIFHLIYIIGVQSTFQHHKGQFFAKVNGK